MLHIYNTLTRQKQVFKPSTPSQVQMYVCGMTVYDYCHLGHARMLLAFDVIQRWLRASGFKVTYVRNITDIDDKIIRRAVENHESIGQLTDRFIKAMHEDTALLGVQAPDHEPRATQFVSRMLEMISTLESKGLAYRASSGDVNFAVRQFEGYGKLSGKSLDDLRAGERVVVDPSKRDPLDFVLWKAARTQEPPESKWESSFGAGRPGWHIECSAMSTALLNLPIDIHGGGPDLKFPHHENEIAQSEGALGTQFVNYWVHNGPLLVGKEKMSKSLGNFFTIRDILKHYHPEVVRFFIIRSHYRSPQDYSLNHLADAKAALVRLYTALNNLDPEVQQRAYVRAQNEAVNWQDEYAARFKAAMDDDFNTALAIAVLFDIVSALNRQELNGSTETLTLMLYQLGFLLGLLSSKPQTFLQWQSPADLQETSNAALGEVSHDTAARQQDLLAADIEAIILARTEAKNSKDFSQADALRQQLQARGIVLEDKPGGVTNWRRV